MQKITSSVLAITMAMLVGMGTFVPSALAEEENPYANDFPSYEEWVENPRNGAAAIPNDRMRMQEYERQKQAYRPKFSDRLKQENPRALETIKESEKGVFATGNKQQRSIEEMPRVAVMYVNNAKTTYDEQIDSLIVENLTKCIDADTYQYIDGTPYIEILKKFGIVDLTTAERSDILDAFAGEDVDYVVFMQINPFLRKDKMTFFTVGKEMTADVPFKIIDVLNNRYLYSGRFTEVAKDSSMLGGIGNKSVALKSVVSVNEQIASVLSARLPKDKPVFIKRSRISIAK